MKTTAKIPFLDARGQNVEGEVSLKDYENAGRLEMSLSAYMARKYPNVPDPFVQACAYSGLYMRANERAGITTNTLSTIFADGVMRLSDVDAGAMVRNDGSDRSVGARLLFPELILNIIASELDEDNTDIINGFNSMIATTLSVNTPRIDEPIIDYTGPDSSRAAPIAQLAEPKLMATITTSERTRKVPTRSIGLVISAEAEHTVNLPLVSIVVQRQARAERIANIYAAITNLIAGNVDSQDPALTPVQSSDFDNTANSPENFSQLAYVKWLWEDHAKRSINSVISDLEGALAIEGRKNKPTVMTDNPQSPRINSETTFENLVLPAPRGIVVPTSVMAGADRVLGFDKRYGIRRVVNTSAQYAAVEEFVMKRGTGYRFDYGETYHKLFTDAFSLLEMA